jgi:mannose-6-phosphate isomerase-like protein (cupin superfamily)
VRLAGAGNTKCDLWRVQEVPASAADGHGLGDAVVTPPPDGGLVYRITVFPPDSEWDRSRGYGDSRGALPGTVPESESNGIPGMHMTDSVDFLTVISGELYAIFETEETLLRPGDTLVQRGTKHAWSNRTDSPVTVVAVMVAAKT